MPKCPLPFLPHARVCARTSTYMAQSTIQICLSRVSVGELISTLEHDQGSSVPIFEEWLLHSHHLCIHENSDRLSRSFRIAIVGELRGRSPLGLQTWQVSEALYSLELKTTNGYKQDLRDQIFRYDLSSSSPCRPGEVWRLHQTVRHQRQEQEAIRQVICRDKDRVFQEEH